MSQKNTLGVILKGGRSRRMGQDKAFVLFDGIPLLEHVCHRLAPQVDNLIINTAFQEGDRSVFGYATCQDLGGEFKGPLAGVAAALNSSYMTAYDYLAVIPCDAPLIPRDLVARLYSEAIKNDLQHVCVILDGYLQPTFSLWHKSLKDVITESVNANDYSLKGVVKLCRSGVLEISTKEAQQFCNINTQDDLQQLIDR